MINKILFVIVPTFPYQTFTNPSENEIYDVTKKGKKARISVGGIPIGVLSISSYIKKYRPDIQIKIVDFNLIISKSVYKDEIDNYSSFEELYKYTLKDYSDFKPDIVAISSIFNTSYECIKNCSQIIRQIFNDSLIVVGGGLATNAYDMILNTIPEVYATCVGEGEIPFKNIVNSVDIKKTFETDPSWVTRIKLQNKSIIKPQFVNDLDEIPSFDYDLVGFYDYAESTATYGNIISRDENEKTRILNICSTRGCPHKCTFCCSHSVHGRIVRYHSAERIIADIQYAIDKYHINTLTFIDDNFLIDKNRALKILAYLKSKNLNVTFPNGFAIYAIDDKIAVALKDAGVKEAALALESGNQETLTNIIKKPLKLEMVSPAIESLHKAGIYVRGFFMIGLPGETRESIQESIDFLYKSDFNWVMIYVATPFFGSEIYDICKKNNYLYMKNEEQFFCHGCIKTPEFTPEYIEKVAYLTNLRVNFLNNYDTRVGNYEMALIRFEKIMKQAKDHALAYYCAAKCCEKLGLTNKQIKYENRFKTILKVNSEWRGYIAELNI